MTTLLTRLINRLTPLEGETLQAFLLALDPPMENLEALRARCKGDESFIQQVCSVNPRLFAYSTYELMAQFGLTKAECQRWTESQRLTVVEYQPYQRGDRHFVRAIYDAYALHQLTPKQLTQWRQMDRLQLEQERQSMVQTNLQLGKDKVQTLDELKETLKELVSNWNGLEPKLGDVFDLAFWTFQTAQWADYYQAKLARATKKRGTYQQQAEVWSEIKEQALRLLATHPLTTVEWVESTGQNPDRVVAYCADHRWEYQQFDRHWKSEFGDSTGDYFHLNRNKILACPHCQTSRYSNQEVKWQLGLKDERVPDFKFNFQLPYEKGVGSLDVMRPYTRTTTSKPEQAKVPDFLSVETKDKPLFSKNQVKKEIRRAVSFFQSKQKAR